MPHGIHGPKDGMKPTSLGSALNLSATEAEVEQLSNRDHAMLVAGADGQKPVKRSTFSTHVVVKVERIEISPPGALVQAARWCVHHAANRMRARAIPAKMPVSMP